MKKLSLLLTTVFCATLFSCIFTPEVHAAEDPICHDTENKIRHSSCEMDKDLRMCQRDKLRTQSFEIPCLPVQEKDLVGYEDSGRRIKDSRPAVFISTIPLGIKSTVLLV